MRSGEGDSRIYNDIWARNVGRRDCAVDVEIVRGQGEGDTVESAIKSGMGGRVERRLGVKEERVRP